MRRRLTELGHRVHRPPLLGHRGPSAGVPAAAATTATIAVGHSIHSRVPDRFGDAVVRFLAER